MRTSRFLISVMVFVIAYMAAPVAFAQWPVGPEPQMFKSMAIHRITSEVTAAIVSATPVTDI